MPKYDAFGREIGEDPRSGLGSDASPERQEPAPEAARPRPQTEPSLVSTPLRPPRQRRRRGLGPIVLFALFVFLAPLLIGGIAIFNAAGGATESVRDTLATRTGSIEMPAARAAPPKGVTGRSLVRRDRFAAALAKLSGSELRLANLRLAPERIDAQLLTRAGRLRSVQVRPGGDIRRFGRDTGPGFDTTPTIAFSRLDARAPQRLARRGAAKLRVPLSTLQYVVPTASTGEVRWVAYFERGRYVMGDAAGRHQRNYP